jgi:tight adherence protein B
MRRALAGTLGLGLAFVIAGPARADNTPRPLEVVSVDKHAFPDLSLVVAAPPEFQGRDVPPNEWRLTQGGKQRPTKVERLGNDQLEVVLAIDTSGSMKGVPIEAAKAAAVAFLQKMPSSAKVAVVGFGDAPYVLSGLSTDRAALIGVVQGLQAGGETALYDALNTAAGQFSPAADARKSIVLLSDGGDTKSTSNLQAVAGALADATLHFSGIALQTPDTDLPALKALADATGGNVVLATDAGALNSVYDSIASSLTNQYRLTFRAQGTGQTEVAVNVTDQGVTAEASRALELPEAPTPASHRSETSAVVRPPDQGWMLGVGLGALCAALLIIGMFAFAPRRRRGGLRGRPILSRQPRTTGPLTGITNRATLLAERSLERHGKQNALNTTLERAGIAVRPGEFVVLTASASFIAFAAGFLLGGLLAGLVLAVATPFGFRFSLKWMADRRRAKFAEQLGDTLQLLSGSLRTGFGMLQAVDAVALEADSPTSEEFQRLVVETRLGRSVPEALHAMSERVGNEDFSWVVQAIDINREVGGDLTEVLDRVAGTIRQRDQVRRQIKALSAEGRLSALILFGLPIGMFAFIRVTNPDYVAELTKSTVGMVMIGLAVFLLTMGGLWLKRIVRVEF